MQVFIPPGRPQAVSYTFRCLFSEFLGIDIEVLEDEKENDFRIQCGKKSIRIENHFFGKLSLESLYRAENVPDIVDDSLVIFGDKEFPLLSIFGKSIIRIDSPSHIHVHSDIVASTFFMLSRWEEAVVGGIDNHDRFDYSKSLAVRADFYNRPVVNEYVEFLWELCLYINPDLKRKKREYTCIATSDIDELRKWKRPKRLFESIYMHLTDGKIRRVIRDLKNFLASISEPKKDFYNNLSFFVDRTKDMKPVFYMKTGSSHPKHDKNEYNLQDYAEELNYALSLGVRFGIHPSYETYTDPGKMKNELEILNSFLGQSARLIRQHYLRFSVPATWKCQEETGLEEDSTMIYPHRAGFRNGVCYPFPVFDFKEDTQLNLYESPLLFMETPYLNSEPEELLTDADFIIQKVKSYSGNFVFLWHNGNLVYKEDRSCFERLLNIATS